MSWPRRCCRSASSPRPQKSERRLFMMESMMSSWVRWGAVEWQVTRVKQEAGMQTQLTPRLSGCHRQYRILQSAMHCNKMLIPACSP